MNSEKLAKTAKKFSKHGLNERDKDEIKARTAMIRDEKIRRGERKGLNHEILDLILSLVD